MSNSNQPLFSFERWQPRLPVLAMQYRQNKPCQHIVLPDFLSAEAADMLVAEFPTPEEARWNHYKHYNENKLGLSTRCDFPPLIQAVVDELNSPSFRAWLSALTSIPDLIADPRLEGGGIHQTERGGFLNIHADFTHHPHEANWVRRCNLILYLNPGWDETWGGALEFWNADMRGCVKRYFPILNHAVVFSTTPTSFHGYPDPISPPAGVTRKSIALYYYTNQANTRTSPIATNYQCRPWERNKAALVWLDKQAVSLYTRTKRYFGLSDSAISRILSRLAKRF